MGTVTTACAMRRQGPWRKPQVKAVREFWGWDAWAFRRPGPVSKGRGETGDHGPPWAERPAPRPWGGSVPAPTRDGKEARLLSRAPSRAWTTLYSPAAPPMDAWAAPTFGRLRRMLRRTRRAHVHPCLTGTRKMFQLLILVATQVRRRHLVQLTGLHWMNMDLANVTPHESSCMWPLLSLLVFDK